MLKKIVIKISLLLLILTGLNFIYNYTFYDADLLEKSKEVLEIKKSINQTDIYYFGESSNITYRENDSIKNSISDLSALFFPKLKLTNINKYATHAGIYKYWIYYMNQFSRKPKAIIITLNMRSFNATWINSKLETSLQESLVLTKPYPNLVNRFMLSLQAFDNRTEKQREKEVLKEWERVWLQFPFKFKYKTVKQWDDAMANGGYLNEDGSWNMKKIELACHFIKAYAFNLNEKNVRIKDFDEISDWCSKNHVNLYLNLMAENIEYADSLVGKELVFLMKQNRDYIVKRFQGDNCTVVDNLELVKGCEFIDQNWTTEHYNYKGRMRIAKNIAEKLQTQFKTEYKKVY